ncbi:MAG: hypothetical protein LBM96_11465 [Methanobrevibacter sp.]|nr:hypothetical protein [Candidatus Methanoflexus mossambicus]
MDFDEFYDLVRFKKLTFDKVVMKSNILFSTYLYNIMVNSSFISNLESFEDK